MIKWFNCVCSIVFVSRMVDLRGRGNAYNIVKLPEKLCYMIGVKSGLAISNQKQKQIASKVE